MNYELLGAIHKVYREEFSTLNTDQMLERLDYLYGEIADHRMPGSELLDDKMLDVLRMYKGIEYTNEYLKGRNR